MSKLTITEALAEIQTIEKRLAKKREWVSNNLFRPEQLRDPMSDKDGGIKAYLKAEIQSIQDLEDRKVRLRCAINRSNDSTLVVLAGRTWSVAEWLAWRREVASMRGQWLNSVTNQ